MRSFHGCDWFPTWARSPVDYWTEQMPRDAAERELGFVAAMGLDHVRIWLSAWGYEHSPSRYLDNLRFVLDTAEALGVGVVLELFDSCGIEPNRRPATTVRIEEIPAFAAGHSGLSFLERMTAGGRDLFAAPGLVPVPWRGDPMAAIWEGFVPNPGYDFLGSEHWDRWDRYATAIVEAVRDHSALVVLSLMNEPFVSQIGADIDRTPIVRFYCHMYELLRPLTPELPLSIGAANMDWFDEHERNLGAPLDVVSVHSLAGPAALEATIEHAQRSAGTRPVYISEWGYFPGGDDAAQLAEYEQLLPVLDRAGVGWAVSHLIMGWGPFANTALLYPSGVMRPAALRVRTWLRDRSAVTVKVAP